MGQNVTHKTVIREALLRGERLTHFDAEKHYGIMRLAAVVHGLENPTKSELRNGVEPMKIERKMVEVPTRYGNGVTNVAQYWVEVKRGQLSLL